MSPIEMVIVELSDGLGNQMFQYAMGRALSVKRGDRLLLFTGRFLRLQKRQFGLWAFRIAGEIVSDLKCLSGAAAVWKIRELNMAFDDEVMRATCSNIILTGYWQSERYFSEIAQTIRRDFEFMEPMASEHLQLAQEIDATESVCVHVRRADYLLPQDSKGFLGSEYYQYALRMIRSKVRDPVFYVFSDDIAWCRAHLTIDGRHRFVAPEERSRDSTVSDLQLMATCKHFIIANSTYSWWGAWLGTWPCKCVIAPRRWFRVDLQTRRDRFGDIRETSVDIIPQHWLRM